jgi:galactofuranose transport system permease protein
MNARNLPLLASLAVFVVGYGICAATFPAMLSTRVAAALLTDGAMLGVLAIGMAFVIISGGIDLSVGAVMGLSCMLVALAVSQWGLHPLAAFPLALAIGIAFGAGVGAVIHFLKAPAFIVTLTAMFLARGATFLMTTESVPIAHPFYGRLSEMAVDLPTGGRLGIIALVMLAATAGAAVLLHMTRFGADVFAMGGDRRAAELTGVPIARTTISVYAISGGAAALAGILLSIYTRSANPLSGVGSELDAIAAAVIGGCLLAGGAGSVLGALVGVLIQGLILTYINFDGQLSSWWAKIVIGGLLFAFIALQRGLLHLSTTSSNTSRR